MYVFDITTAICLDPRHPARIELMLIILAHYDSGMDVIYRSMFVVVLLTNLIADTIDFPI